MVPTRKGPLAHSKPRYLLCLNSSIHITLVPFILYLSILHSYFFDSFISSFITILNVLSLLYMFIPLLKTPWSSQPRLHTHWSQVSLGDDPGIETPGIELVLNYDISFGLIFDLEINCWFRLYFQWWNFIFWNSRSTINSHCH